MGQEKKITVELSEDEALVLHAWLARTGPRVVEDQAEERALWDLECQLDPQLDDLFSSEYDERLALARSRVRDVVLEFGAPAAGEGDWLARLPAGIASKDALMDALSVALTLPAHFGRNWDALWDCITDLGWRPERRIVLIHDDVPALDDDELTIYVRLLRDAVEHWRGRAGRELVVAFPPGAADAIKLRGG